MGEIDGKMAAVFSNAAMPSPYEPFAAAQVLSESNDGEDAHM